AAVGASGAIGGSAVDRLDATVAFDGGVIEATVDGRAPGEASASLAATITLGDDGAVQIDGGTIKARVGDLGRLLTEAEVGVVGSGTVTAELTVRGRVGGGAPADLAVSGTVAGRRLRHGRTSIAALDLVVHGGHLPSRPRGRGRLEV